MAVIAQTGTKTKDVSLRYVFLFYCACSKVISLIFAVVPVPSSRMPQRTPSLSSDSVKPPEPQVPEAITPSVVGVEVSGFSEFAADSIAEIS